MQLALSATSGTGDANAPAVSVDQASRFGDYALIEPLGRGGMGIVYRARQVSLGRLVALKMIGEVHMASPLALQRFQAEAETAAKLDHPNIVPIYEVGEHEGVPFFSMKLIEGHSLADQIVVGNGERAKGEKAWEASRSPAQHPVPVANPAPFHVGRSGAMKAASLVATVARAVHYAHQHGVLHRDLKPSNVLLDAKGSPYLTDFGVAKVLATQSELSLTLTGAVLGTPSYMAPEQAMGGRITTAVDIYSLGAILYELLTGRPPFQATTPLETLRQVTEREPTPPTTFNALIPRDLATICLKCLEKDPARRYSNAEALTEDLDRFTRDEPIQARPVGTSEKFTRWCRRNPKLAGSLAALAVAIVAGFVGVTTQWQHAQRNAERESAQRHRAEQTVTRLEIERAETLFAADNSADALAYLALILRRDPSNRVAAERIVSALTQRSFCLPAFELAHTGRVTAAQWSPDGQRILTSSIDGTAQLWDGHTGAPLGQPLRHSLAIQYARFSPDGGLVVTASSDKTAQVWDVVTGQPVAPPLEHDSAVLLAEFSPDSRFVVTGAEGWTNRRATGVWEARTGKNIAWLTTTGNVNNATFTMDGSRMLLSSWTAKKAWLYSFPELVELATFPQTPRDDRGPQFSPQGDRVATADPKQAVIWDIRAEPRILGRCNHNTYVYPVQFSPDGQLLATGSIDNTARVWDGHTGAPVTPPLRHSKYVQTIQFSPDGQHVVTGSDDRTARIWDARTGQPLTEPLRPHGALLLFAQFSPDGRRLLVHPQSRTAWVWDIRFARPYLEPLRHTRSVQRVRFSDDSRILLTATRIAVTAWDTRTGRPLIDPIEIPGFSASDESGVIFSSDGKLFAETKGSACRLFDVSTRRALPAMLQHSTKILATRFSPSGRFIATGSEDLTARIWDPRTGELRRILRHSGMVRAIAFSPDERWVVTGALDGTVQVWESDTGKETVMPLRHRGGVMDVVFSPDGLRVLTASMDNTARIWDARTGAQLALLAHANELSSARFSPEGKRVATISVDTVQVWDALAGRPVTAPLKHDTRVNSVRFSPDGRIILTSCGDGAARTWDTETGHLLGEPLRHDQEVKNADFSPDGRLIATSSTDGTARLWEVPQVPVPVPKWLPDVAEAFAGQRLTEQNNNEVVPISELRRLREELPRDPLATRLLGPMPR